MELPCDPNIVIIPLFEQIYGGADKVQVKPREMPPTQTHCETDMPRIAPWIVIETLTNFTMPQITQLPPTFVE